MAFFNDEQEQDDELNQGGGVQTSAPLSTISGQGIAPQGTGTAKASAPDKSSNFVGIKQYIDANKTQASKLGDQAAGVINNSANEARQKVGDLNSAANSSIQSTAPLDNDISQKLSTAAETLAPEQRDQIKKTASAQYKGPKDEFGFGDAYTNAQKATNTAVQNIDKSGTEQGRMGLLKQINSKPRTQGMDVFDNVLLQAGGGREKLSQATQNNQDIKGALDSTTESIRNKIGRADDPSTPDVDESSGAIGTTAKAQADAYQKIQDALSAWKTGFTPRIDQSRQDLIGLNNRLTTDLSDTPDILDNETLGLYGLNPNTNIYDLNLQDYMKQASPTDLTTANLASAEDYARYGALADLAGEQDLMLRPEDAAQAGTAPKTTIDTSKLATDRQAKEQYAQTLNQQALGAQSDYDSFAKSIGYGDPELWFLNSRLPGNAARLASLQAAAQEAAAARDKFNRNSRTVKSSGK